MAQILSLILATIVMGTPIARADNGALVIRALETSGRFIILRSEDCRFIYYSPRQLTVRPEKSVFLDDKGGASLLLVVSEDQNPPTDVEKAAFEKKFSKLYQECPERPKIVRYPEYLTEIDIRGDLQQRRRFKVAKSESLGGGDRLFHIQFIKDVKGIAKSAIRDLTPILKIRYFSNIVEAEASLEINYDLAVEYISKTYLTRRCVIERECKTQWWKKRCHSHEYCEDTPIVLQIFDNLNYQSKQVIRTVSQENADPQVVKELKDRLVSRFLLSSFSEISSVNTADAVQVTFGELKKEASGTYFERLQKINLVERMFETEIKLERKEFIPWKS